MWLIILAVFLLALIWAGGYFLAQLGVTVWLWLQVLLTVLVVLGALIAIFAQKLRALWAAKALEREMMRQAELQIMNARPDRRAEIQALQAQMQRSIGALRVSHMGRARGASALYALPWYVIIGPPGAGKTTALRHSGLVLSDTSQDGRIRGVGGTRNCDWWFTNDGILLDTAGRYATEYDDHQEWLAFLGMLKKYRSRKPINGVLVAISVADLAMASEDQIENWARTLRGRVDEVMTRLQMVVPVYVMFTKTDLIGGFVEYWDDLRKSERSQIWGTTYPLVKASQMENAKAFETEFDRLVGAIHSRALRRLAFERQPQLRQKIFQFPLEFQALRNNLSDFVATLFQPNAFQQTPLFRGFYFTSGTQEGRPIDRVILGMAQAFGMRPPVQVTGQFKESKSYFVGDLLRQVVFPDQDVAGHTAIEDRRRFWNRLGMTAAIIATSMVLILPSSCTFFGNGQLLLDTREIVAETQSVSWTDTSAMGPKLKKLDKLRSHVEQLRTWNQDGPPVALRWGMYIGDTLYPPVRSSYLGALNQSFINPSKQEIENRLKAIDPDPKREADLYNVHYDALKLYLMLSDRELLEPEWAVPQLAALWTKMYRLQNADQAALTAQATFYLKLLKDGEAPLWNPDRNLVAKSRASLTKVPQVQRIYSELVRKINNEIISVKRETVFSGAVERYVKSRNNMTVPGVYTKRGWARVRALLGSQQTKGNIESWVLGNVQQESSPEMQRQIVELRNQYFEAYKKAWSDFLADLVFLKPDNYKTAIDELSVLSEPEWPLLRLMRLVDENTTLEVTDQEAGKPDPTLQQLVQKGIKANKDPKKLNAALNIALPNRPMSSVEQAFKPMTVFALPPPGVDPDKAPTGLSQYMASVGQLVGVLTDARDDKGRTSSKTVDAAVAEANRTTNSLLDTQSGYTRPLLSPLLMNPISVSSR